MQFEQGNHTALIPSVDKEKNNGIKLSQTNKKPKKQGYS